VAERKATIIAGDVKSRLGTNYPAEHAQKCATREKRALGDPFGLTQFGVNLTTLPPGCWSSLRHWHQNEDEFVYVIDGEITLIDEEGAHLLVAGMCAGFKAGDQNGHHLVNRGTRTAHYLEVGSRMAEEQVIYSDIDMKVTRQGGGANIWAHKDGKPY
jgi:uncharacterized cupin superfamily protein